MPSTELFQLWRCWVIWTGSGRMVAYAVVSFPALCTLASFGEIHILYIVSLDVH